MRRPSSISPAGFVVRLLIVSIGLFGVFFFGLRMFDDTPKATPTPPKTVLVTYEISGPLPSVPITVSMLTAGGLEQHDTHIPFQRDIATPIGTTVRLAATLQDAGTVTCSMSIDHYPVKSSSSTGAFTTCAVETLAQPQP